MFIIEPSYTNIVKQYVFASSNQSSSFCRRMMNVESSDEYTRMTGSICLDGKRDRRTGVGVGVCRRAMRASTVARMSGVGVGVGVGSGVGVGVGSGVGVEVGVEVGIGVGVGVGVG